MQTTSDACPCGLGDDYKDCCGIYIDGKELAPDPESLMRSRYTAFARQNIDYLKETWHPETLPDDLDQSEPSRWVRLDVIDASTDEEEVEGEVEFIAKLIHDNKLETLHEFSQFDKVDGRWLYYTGIFPETTPPVVKIPKDQPCPCESGKSFKNCHFER